MTLRLNDLRRTALLFFALTTACGGGKSATPGDSGAGDGPPGSTADGIPGVTGLVAGNGVPIPDPPLKEPCAALGIAAKSCAPGDACPALTCDCPAGPRMIPILDSCLYTHRCLVGVSCPAVCAAGMEVSDQLFVCLFAGSCKSNADCTDPASPRCLLAPADTNGHCTSLQTGSDCYRDSDCGAVCVATTGGPRWCQNKMSGSPCNRDDQCQPGDVAGVGGCILPDGQYAGACTDGHNGAPCHTSDQCLPGYACVGVQDFFGTCSSRTKGAPCAVDADCFQGFCITDGPGKCDSGEPGATCAEPADCRVPSCFEQKCTGGATGAPCNQDSQCATKKCTQNSGVTGPVGQCTDGKAGSACEGSNTNQCEAGLHCLPGSPGKCAPPGGVGTPCARDVDCLTQKCGGLPNGPAGLAICTEGKLGQRCRESAQCDPGLHCVSNGFAGVCVAGQVGDPCALAVDCDSGQCPDRGGALPTFCYGFADLAPCANGDVCVASICFPTCK
jgi:hypothetical protein